MGVVIIRSIMVVVSQKFRYCTQIPLQVQLDLYLGDQKVPQMR